MAAAKATTERIEAAAKTPAEKVDFLYRLTLGRRPTDRERAFAVEFLGRSPLTELCRAVFNLNSFVYLE